MLIILKRTVKVLLLLAIIGLLYVNIYQARVIERQRQEIRMLFKALRYPQAAPGEKI